MSDNIDPYSPCYCGSGKKYRFCCQRKKNNSIAPPAKREHPVIFGDLADGERLHDQGLKYMQLGQFEQAINWFTQVLESDRTICSPANNLALCLFFTGKFDEAIRVQRQSFEDSPSPNPFGMANLAWFHLILGEEKEAEDAASQAAIQQALNVEATIKVCETLARFKRHRDIMETADASDFRSDPNVRFYTGVAAANLGDSKRAIEDLSCVPIGHIKGKMAQQYVQHLKNNTQPNTVRKDWPYLLPQEFCISHLIKQDDAPMKTLMSSRYMVDFVEARLNAEPDDTEDAVKLLDLCKHPEATALLWLILKGTFGPDKLRFHAVRILTKKGEIQPGEEIELLQKGKPTKQQLISICLNSEFSFCEVPPDIDKRYHKLFLAGRKPFPDWSKIAVGYQELLKEAPHFYPLQYNYAVSLIYTERGKEAESILRSLVDEYPEYLFARASLLSILVFAKRLTEADQVAQRSDFPKETHPDAYAAWLVSMTEYLEASGKNADAYSTIKTAHDFASNNPNVARVWSRWEDYNEEKDTSYWLRLKHRFNK